MRKQRTVALLGRETGLLVLRDALIGHPALDLQAVVTHARLPKAEGGGERLELGAYRALCATAGVPLIALDYPQALALEDHVSGAIDLMIVLSWRFRIRPEMLNRLQLGGINLHRGALPAYGGAEPVRRAIEAGESRTAITAHRLAEEIDAGAEIARVWLDMAPLPSGVTSAAYAEIVKQRLYGLYALLARLAVGALCA